jgi:mannose-6-phosphate isomerase-like protein (cupin superfamily)
VTVRRVVTGVVDGVSRIVEDGPAPRATGWDNLWVASPDEPLGHDPGDGGTMAFSAGSVHWRVFDVPPEAVLRKMLEASQSDLVTPDGFHRTNTIDYVYVLDGAITLQLEEGEVALEPGDCVVQRFTNHAWHNYGEAPVRLLAVMVGLS